jgi:hypothetical protein
MEAGTGAEEAGEENSVHKTVKSFVPNAIPSKKISAAELFPGTSLWKRILRSIVLVSRPVVLWVSGKR